jgi:hypothetical protein
MSPFGLGLYGVSAIMLFWPYTKKVLLSTANSKGILGQKPGLKF